jgi:hypothetical protein
MDIAIVVFTVISGCTTTPRCTRRAPAWCAAYIQTPWKLAPSQHPGYPGPIVELS